MSISILKWLEPSINLGIETATLNSEKTHALIDEQISQMLAEIKDLLPDSKKRSVKRMEDLIKDRIVYTARDVYRFGFDDACKIYR